MDRIYNEEMWECIVYTEKWKRQYSNTISLIGEATNVQQSYCLNTIDSILPRKWKIKNKTSGQKEYSVKKAKMIAETTYKNKETYVNIVKSCSKPKYYVFSVL